MGFGKVWVLLLLFAVPILFLLFIRSWNLFSKFRESNNFSVFLNRSTFPTTKQRLAVCLIRLSAVGLIVIGLAEPFFYVTSKDNVYHNVRLIFLIDVSRSMEYAEDIPPNRLIAAKKEIAAVYSSLEGNYETAIIPFAGQPNLYYCPLTTSRMAISTALRELDGNYVPTLGTNLVAVFDSYSSTFVKIEDIEKSGLNLVVLLSDGGKHESSNIDRNKLLSIIRKLASKNSRVYTVGIGEKKSVPLVRRDERGDFIDYLRDKKNNVLYSQLDEEILETIAKAGNGSYVNFNSDTKLQSFLYDLVMENRTAGGEVFEYEKFYFHPFCYAFSAILIWIAAMYNRRLWRTN